MSVTTVSSPRRAALTGLAVRPLALAVLCLIAVTLLAAPMFFFDVVPMMDFPSHLTRLSLLARGPLDPLLARAYAVNVPLAPNLAIDLVVPALAPWIGAGAALKGFMAAGLALWVAGAALIHRGLWREWSAQSVFAIFFAANPSFYFGFANFHFGAGAALAATGLWLAYGRRSPLWIGAMALTALALLLCHLMAVALFAMLMIGFELGRGRASARADYLALAAMFAPGFAVWALLCVHSRGIGLEFHWLQNALGLLFFSSGAGAIRGNLYPFAAMCGAMLLARRWGALTLSPRARPVLALTALAMALCPAVAMGGALIQIRLPSVLCVLALSALRIELPAQIGALLVAATLAGAAAAGAREAAHWGPDAQSLADIREAGRRFLPPGARVASALAAENGSMLGHAAELTMLDRATFTPTFFTTPGQSTFTLRAPYQAIGARDAIEGAIPTLAELTPRLGAHPPAPGPTLRPYADLGCAFEYLFVIGAGARAATPALVPLVERADFALYRIAPQRPCPPR